MRFSSASAQSRCTNATLCHFSGIAARLRLNFQAQGMQEWALKHFPFVLWGLTSSVTISIVSAWSAGEAHWNCQCLDSRWTPDRALPDPHSSPSPGIITSISAGLEPVNRNIWYWEWVGVLATGPEAFRLSCLTDSKGTHTKAAFSSVGPWLSVPTAMGLNSCPAVSQKGEQWRKLFIRWH